eukprot:1681167-Pyramimonas_sp.AAC.1
MRRRNNIYTTEDGKTTHTTTNTNRYNIRDRDAKTTHTTNTHNESSSINKKRIETKKTWRRRKRKMSRARRMRKI